jgi:hypothetical protein
MQLRVVELELRQKRMQRYLKATQASFELAVERSSSLGKAANGVLAGPVIHA